MGKKTKSEEFPFVTPKDFISQLSRVINNAIKLLIIINWNINMRPKTSKLCRNIYIFFLLCNPTPFHNGIQIETIHKARNYPKLHESYIQEHFYINKTSDKCTICSGHKHNSCFSLVYNAVISLLE